MTEIKAPTRLARLLVGWIWAFFAVRLVLVAVMAVNLLAFYGHVPEHFPYPALMLAAKLTMWGNLGVHFVAGLLSLIWIHRMSRNANILTGGLPISPGWAVGWYFVPIGALWKPFEAIEQAWQASTKPLAWRSVPTPPLLRWWWGLWLGAGAVSTVLGMSQRSGNKDQAADSILLVVISALVMVQCVLFSRIVRRLSDLQAASSLDVFD